MSVLTDAQVLKVSHLRLYDAVAIKKRFNKSLYRWNIAKKCFLLENVNKTEIPENFYPLKLSALRGYTPYKSALPYKCASKPWWKCSVSKIMIKSLAFKLQICSDATTIVSCFSHCWVIPIVCIDSIEANTIRARTRWFYISLQAFEKSFYARII